MDFIAEIDPKTLSWIKQEVAETLNGVRHGLETFVEQGTVSALPACVENLHRIRGAIDMVEITGPALLAREMEETAAALAENRVEHKKDAVEVLMRGIIQLPGYLEHLYHGNKDVPLVLLPILNDLRAVQNKELLTEGAFFFTDLSITKPSLIAKGNERPTWDSRTIAKKLRPGYLQGLLGLFRGVDVQKSLKMLATVVLNLEQSTTQVKAEQLWWVTAGVLHALYDKGLDASVAVKLLLGRVDRIIKRVVDGGEGGLNCEPPNELIKNLLYYVARSTSTAPRVLELKKAFKLEQAVPDTGMLDQARDELIGFNANLMANMSEQIKEELLRIKDDMDIAMHANHGDAASLEPVVERLHTVADALDMLGMQHLRKLARQQEEQLRIFIDKKTSLKDNDVMNVAGALLYIESSLYDLNVQKSVELLQAGGGANPTGIPEAEYRQLVKVVGQEALVEIAKIKDAIGRYLIEMNQVDALKETPEMLNALRGVLAMLSHDRPVRVLYAVRQYMAVELLDKQVIPDPVALDLLANAIDAVSYFIESLLEKAVAPEQGLELAEKSMTSLGYAPRRVAKEQGALGQIDEDTAKSPMTLVPQKFAELESSPSEEVDQELIFVFLAEADDELEAINDHLQKWKADRDDQEALNMLMRSFHTLKGAGRIIGATSIGVLAWSIEELLRRALDGRVPATGRLFDLLEQVVAALSDLIAQIKNGGPAKTAYTVQPLIDLARELRQPAQVAVT